MSFILQMQLALEFSALWASRFGSIIRGANNKNISSQWQEYIAGATWETVKEPETSYAILHILEPPPE